MAAVVRYRFRPDLGMSLLGRLAGVALPKPGCPTGLSKCCLLHHRQLHESVIPRGRGGRSSFGGIVATVFGATGFLGRYVVGRLGHEGNQVIIPYRGDSYDTAHLQPMGDLGQLIFREWYAWDEDSIRNSVKNSNVVINLVGREWESNNFSYDDVFVKIPQNLARISKEEGVQRFIHMSHINADVGSPSPFLRAKGLGEQVVREAFPEAIILKPSDIYGQEDTFFNYFACLRLFGGVPLIKMGKDTSKKPVFIVDIAKAIVQSARDPNAPGQTYVLTGYNRYSLHEIVKFVYSVAHRPFIPYHLPTRLYMLWALCFEKFSVHRWTTRDKVNRMHISDLDFPGLPGLEDLGIKPSSIESKTIEVVRRHRIHRWLEEDVEEAQLPKIIVDESTT
uniref:NADH dehydrogenase [ubiquinone] 1 alpha subcomplex subunit 9, mitochondrial n=1 Tax=Myxine glutinosa TaxID=7769 RepID=UPI00358E81C9